jgi:hypothetical protein
VLPSVSGLSGSRDIGVKGEALQAGTTWVALSDRGRRRAQAAHGKTGSDAVAVTEVSEAGAVPALRVANASDRPVHRSEL